MDSKGVWEDIKDVKVGGYPAHNVIIVGSVLLLLASVTILYGFHVADEPIGA